MPLIQNVYRRGAIYWWRRKISVAGHELSVAMSMRTADPTAARSIAHRLGAAVEDFRMAYGDTGTVVDQATLKRIFGDAMRWQLDRIATSQSDPLVSRQDAALLNKVSAEFWRNHALRPSRGSANGGAELNYSERWDLDDHERLRDLGWTKQERLALRDMCDRFGSVLVSGDLLAKYQEEFGYAPTSTNDERVRRVIYQARAQACDEATRRLDAQEECSLEAWAADALSEKVLQMPLPQAPTLDTAAPPPPIQSETTETATPTAPPATPARSKKLLTEALAECIQAYEADKAWDPRTSDQARTAIRLFDHACGGNIHIEDIQQHHVRSLGLLFAELPNRWGRTKAELAGGLTATMARAKTLPPEDLGLSQSTRRKHIGFIEQVLAHAVGDADVDEEHGHRPTKAISFENLKKGVGKKNRKRSRDLRANWTKKEIERLLAAPVWTGSLSLDARFQPGTEIFHDAWYWLPLMFVLYGGRSSEIVGLELTEVFEDGQIPYFRIDYTDLRRIKNVQSIRSLPIHPELIRLGFLDYVREIRALGHRMLFPEMHSADSKSFASTFYKSVFGPWRKWSFPEGTAWRHRQGMAWIDKDVHSFRGAATTLMKGKVQDSVRIDILGHEGEETISSVYDEEAALNVKLKALKHLTVLTQHIEKQPLRLRPADRQRFGGRRGRPPNQHQS